MNIFKNMHKNVLIMVFNPIEGFYKIKKSRFSYYHGLIFILAAGLARLFQIHVTHYPLTSILPRDAYLSLELIKVFIPVFSWIIVSYGLSSIRNGEAKFRDVVAGTGYSLIPYIILIPLISIISNILSLNDAGTYNLLGGVSTAWITILFFVQVRELNNYKISETFIHIGLTFFGIFFVWVILSLGYLLSANFITFARSVIFEIRMILLGQ